MVIKVNIPQNNQIHLQFLMSEMKTARPRIPSPRTAGIVVVLDLKQGPYNAFSTNNQSQNYGLFTYLKVIKFYCINTYQLHLHSFITNKTHLFNISIT